MALAHPPHLLKPALPGLLAIASAISSPAGAAVIYETNGPFGSPFGLIGFDISSDQSVAVRFTPETSHRLDRVSVWFMSNDFSGATHPLVTLTVRSDDSTGTRSIPGGQILETWTFNVSAVGWDPVLEVVNSQRHPLLAAGENYWVVASSDAPGGLDGVWNWASFETGFTAICNGTPGFPCQWSSGTGAVPATIVEGTPVSAADLDGDGLVTALDLGILLSSWSIPPPAPGCSGATVCPSDLNGDGFVNSLDLGILLSAWSVR